MPEPVQIRSVEDIADAVIAKRHAWQIERAETVEDPELEALLKGRAQEAATMTDQYRRVASAANHLFNALAETTAHPAWEEDGIGSCHEQPGVTFDDYMTGPVFGGFSTFWNKIAQALQDQKDLSDNRSCLFHEKGKGCILGSLKPARCLSHIDGTDEEERKRMLGEHIHILYSLKDVLMRVMFGVREEGVPVEDFDPVENEPFVQEAVANLEAATRHVQAFKP